MQIRRHPDRRLGSVDRHLRADGEDIAAHHLENLQRGSWVDVINRNVPAALEKRAHNMGGWNVVLMWVYSNDGGGTAEDST